MLRGEQETDFRAESAVCHSSAIPAPVSHRTHQEPAVSNAQLSRAQLSLIVADLADASVSSRGAPQHL